MEMDGLQSEKGGKGGIKGFRKLLCTPISSNRMSRRAIQKTSPGGGGAVGGCLF